MIRVCLVDDQTLVRQGIRSLLALAEGIDALTMETHYSKHHATYTKNLNDVAEKASIAGKSIEDVLSQHADVAMVAVVGVPDDKWGEAVTAVVVPRDGARPNEQELIELVKARKGSAHAPKHIKFVDALPMTGVGKVDKKVLKAGFWTGRDRMVG